MSKDFLFSSRLGLPYPKEQFYSKDGNVLCHMSRGRNKIQLPLTKFNFLEFCIKLYQPILIEGMNCAYDFYNTDYIKNLCYDFDNGIGKIFINGTNNLPTYPSEKSDLWRPNFVLDYEKLFITASYEILNAQSKLLKDNNPSYKNVDPELRKTIIQNKDFALKMNSIVLDKFKNTHQYEPLNDNLLLD
jgi:hypothetical protein